MTIVRGLVALGFVVIAGGLAYQATVSVTNAGAAGCAVGAAFAGLAALFAIGAYP